MKMTVHTK